MGKNPWSVLDIVAKRVNFKNLGVIWIFFCFVWWLAFICRSLYVVLLKMITVICERFPDVWQTTGWGMPIIWKVLPASEKFQSQPKSMLVKQKLLKVVNYACIFLINLPNSSKMEGVDLPDEIYLVVYSGTLPKLHLDYMLGSAMAYSGVLCIEARFQE